MYCNEQNTVEVVVELWKNPHYRYREAPGAIKPLSACWDLSAYYMIGNVMDVNVTS